MEKQKKKKPKCLLKGLVSTGKLRSNVLIALSQSVLSWVGESDQFRSAKSLGLLAMQNGWFDVRMFVLTSETMKLTES